MRRRGCAGRGADHQIGGLCHIDASFGQACDDTNQPRISGSPTTRLRIEIVRQHLAGIFLGGDAVCLRLGGERRRLLVRKVNCQRHRAPFLSSYPGEPQNVVLGGVRENVEVIVASRDAGARSAGAR